jgi:hypothetical protein
MAIPAEGDAQPTAHFPAGNALGPSATEPQMFRRRHQHMGATGDCASNARPAVRQLVQWQITLIIEGSMASRHTAPHAHTIVPIAPPLEAFNPMYGLTRRLSSQSHAKPPGA